MNEWQPITSHPREQNVEVLMPNDTILVAHWAEGGGDEQPLYRGWFVDVPGTKYTAPYYRAIETPKAWRLIK